MDHLSQLCLENTVTVKVDCILNQQILGKNFSIILNALKDLKSQQDKHSNQLKNLSTIKQLFDKFKSEQNNIQDQQKGLNGLNGNNINTDGNNQNNNNETQFNKSEDDQNQSSKNDNMSKNNKNMSNSDLMKQIQKIKQKMNKQDGFINQNTKDVNILTKDMHLVKDQIQKLKLLVNNGSNNQMNGSNNSNQINMQSINNINSQAHRSREDINKLLNQMQNMRNKIINIQKQLQDLKSNQNNIQSIIQNNSDKNINNSQSSNNNNNNNNIDSNKLMEILRKIDSLNKKTDMIQQECNKNAIKLQNVKQDTNKNTQDIDNIHKQLQKISKILSKIQNIHNLDESNLEGQIQKIKDQVNMLFKLIDNIRPSSGTQDKKNSKGNTDRSFRIRSDSSAKQDLNSRINQLNARLTYLQKALGSKSSIEDPQKLPQIKRRQLNQTGFNKDSKAYKKQINDIKHDLQIWIKSYMNNNNVKGQHDFGDLQLKIQQIKNTLHKKADHEGMKKGLAFLQGKITQIFMFLTQPESEDAMIVKKGFNCLSCSKKVQNLRGKLGPRMNWDLLNTTSYNNHTPPKGSYSKYSQSPEKEHINNLN